MRKLQALSMIVFILAVLASTGDVSTLDVSLPHAY
ncbi:hypothetical protein SAMN05216352_107173 [Alteribacillus bidgolensis]|uniref:Uncharacterized protein n=1 Tax=Alteribacillus bidgolensis TaxID=930129 RepID=A0A1G8KD60_9BACI|nr:hypothetical protein SAMN05216352_107173 [Alteribacillus bidgolensis]